MKKPLKLTNSIPSIILKEKKVYQAPTIIYIPYNILKQYHNYSNN
jgi:hypothetical protein